MTTSGAKAQGSGAADLTIGDLAERTGLTPAVLRMWESRHGFPVPRRLDSGHRRYAETDVATVTRVLRRRDAGVRLEVAIAEVSGQDAKPGGRSVAASPSVFAELRRRHPHLRTHTLAKSTLLALSWAIEDEALARAHQAMVLGAFQEERYYRAALPRWNELARVTRATVALAAFDGGDTPDAAEAAGRGRPLRVHLSETAPMRREWAVICDGPGFTAALAAWELPGQEGVPDHRRRFESLWTVEPRAVRDAALVCLRVARDAGGQVDVLLDELLETPLPAADPAAAEALLARVLTTLDPS
ncbi:DICT sensory domain-containing protein [Nocardioides donggukensis]|uniref:MerR family transcriptional regulator n=1 Tax=Nocardioides donggukensis TaxID=2774019 RepID=A0A927KBD0_9ACTN|nr:DICT sensory domain-containing protein [Nocardioides donggukensis]MBD8871181.1 MerR family transcriptional regulator [Nocardioides donggukensis]